MVWFLQQIRDHLHTFIVGLLLAFLIELLIDAHVFRVVEQCSSFDAEPLAIEWGTCKSTTQIETQTAQIQLFSTCGFVTMEIENHSPKRREVANTLDLFEMLNDMLQVVVRF